MWNKTKRQLENLICDALKKRVSYFATMYRRSDDGMGRVCIMVDGQETLNCSYVKWELNWYREMHNIKSNPGYAESGNNFADEEAQDIVRHNGIFSSYDFYNAAKCILNEPIEKCLVSEDDLVLSMALIDRRAGKRTLKKLGENISDRGLIVQYFYKLRCEAEGIAAFN